MQVRFQDRKDAGGLKIRLIGHYAERKISRKTFELVGLLLLGAVH